MKNKIEKLKKKIVPFLKKNKVVRAGIFGSYARGEEKKNSDVDILVKFLHPVGFRFAGIEIELEKKLGKNVDLLTYRSIHPLLKKRILKEEIRII